MSKLGALLKEEREKKGLSIHEVGLTLKISPKILKAIEEGIEKDLPAKTFIRGFVKSYASYLKIDSQKVLALFAEEYSPPKESPSKLDRADSPSASAESNVNHSSISVERSSRKPKDEISAANQSTNKNLTVIIAGVLLIAIAFVAKMMDKYKRESNTSSQAELIESLSATTTLPAPEELTAEAISDAGLAETAKSSSVSTPTTNPPNANASVPASSTSTPTIPPTLPPSTTTTTTLVTKVPATTTTTTLKPLPVTTSTSTSTTTITTSTTTTTLAKNVLTEVIVEALNQVKIRFSLNAGQKWESLELAADKVHTFRSNSNIQLEISDGGAVNVILNGRDRGVPGTIGKPIKLSYPK